MGNILHGNGLPQQQMQPQVAVAQPINDVQLVALIAANLNGFDGPAERVAEAKEIVIEAILQAGGTKLMEAVQARQRAAG